MNNNTDIIQAFLEDGGYESVEEWAADSDYEERDGEWFYADDWQPEGPVDIIGCIEGAIEASGFEA